MKLKEQDLGEALPLLSADAFEEFTQSFSPVLDFKY